MDYNKLEETLTLDIQKIEELEDFYGILSLFKLGSHYRFLTKKVKGNLITGTAQKKLIIKLLNSYSLEELNQLLNDLQTEKQMKMSLMDLKKIKETEEVDDVIVKSLVEILTKE